MARYHPYRPAALAIAAAVGPPRRRDAAASPFLLMASGRRAARPPSTSSPATALGAKATRRSANANTLYGSPRLLFLRAAGRSWVAGACPPSGLVWLQGALPPAPAVRLLRGYSCNGIRKRSVLVGAGVVPLASCRLFVWRLRARRLVRSGVRRICGRCRRPLRAATAIEQRIRRPLARQRTGYRHALHAAPTGNRIGWRRTGPSAAARRSRPSFGADWATTFRMSAASFVRGFLTRVAAHRWPLLRERDFRRHIVLRRYTCSFVVRPSVVPPQAHARAALARDAGCARSALTSAVRVFVAPPAPRLDRRHASVSRSTLAGFATLRAAAAPRTRALRLPSRGVRCAQSPGSIAARVSRVAMSPMSRRRNSAGDRFAGDVRGPHRHRPPSRDRHRVGWSPSRGELRTASRARLPLQSRRSTACGRAAA